MAEQQNQLTQQILKDVFGFHTFRGDQEAIISQVITGGDAVVLMPTGGGKSLCYQIPAIVRQGTGVVISPLVALMQDQVVALKSLGVKAETLNSTLSASQTAAIENEFLAGNLDLLYLAPERLANTETLNMLQRSKVALFAIDEAHCVAQWGHDFRPDYLTLEMLHELWPKVPRVALTATATPETHRELTTRLRLENAKHFVTSFNRPNISYSVDSKEAATTQSKNTPKAQLVSFIKEKHLNESGIVYVLNRKKTEEIAAALNSANIPAVAYHAGLTPIERNEAQRRFLEEDGLVVVATIAFGMGIDKPNIRFVAHLDLPKSVEGYYQETGRAGRDGLPAEAWMLYGLQDVVQQKRFIDTSSADTEIKLSQKRRLDHMLAFCESVSCRRKYLLNYFGETDTPDNCGNCDVCVSPPQLWDATIPAQMFLSTVLRTKNERGMQYAAGQHIDVLRGKTSPRVKQMRLDQLSTWGIGTELTQSQWRAVVRHLVAVNTVYATGDWGVLGLTDVAKPVLRGEEKVFMRKPAKTKSVTQKTVTKRKTAGKEEFTKPQTEMFEKLRQWRADKARHQKVPGYVVFHNATLIELVTQKPRNREELLQITGIGKTKLERYGDEILDLMSSSL